MLPCAASRPLHTDGLFIAPSVRPSAPNPLLPSSPHCRVTCVLISPLLSLKILAPGTLRFSIQISSTSVFQHSYRCIISLAWSSRTSKSSLPFLDLLLFLHLLKGMAFRYFTQVSEFSTFSDQWENNHLLQKSMNLTDF